MGVVEWVTAQALTQVLQIFIQCLHLTLHANIAGLLPRRGRTASPNVEVVGWVDGGPEVPNTTSLAAQTATIC